MWKPGQYQESNFVLDSNESRGAVSVPSWSSYSTVLSKSDIDGMQKLEGQLDSSLETLLSSDASLGTCVCHVFENISDAGVLTYTLKIVEDAILPGVEVRANLLFGVNTETDLLSGHVGEPSNNGPQFNIEPFVKLLSNGDVAVQARSLYVLSLMLSVSGLHPSQADLIKFVISHVMDILDTNGSNSVIAACLQSLSILLRNGIIRNHFNSRGGVSALMICAEKSYGDLGSDSQYTFLLCLWSACFDPKGAEQVDQAALAVLVNILKSEPPVRNMRVCIAAIRLIIEDLDRQKAMCETLIEAKVPKLLDALYSGRRIKDIELLVDIEWMRKTLVANFSVLTTFARHEQELLTKKLKWSMVHEEIFWKENALKFENNNFSSVRLLLGLLKEAKDEQTKAVACSDIGYFVQYFPNGKVIVDSHGGKMLLMNLLADESPAVQKQALLACSKIMVNNWVSVKAN